MVDRRLLKAMTDVPRELFVPLARQSVAYMDEAVPLTGDVSPNVRATKGRAGAQERVLLAPRTFAKLVALADPPDDAVVLDIGVGLGYSTMVLSRFAKLVIGLESDAVLAGQAAATLKAQGAANAEIVIGPLPMGYAARAPYDVILINGAIHAGNAALFDQLKDGGRLVAILGVGPQAKACVWRRSGTHTTLREAFDVAGPLLPGFEQKPSFVF